MPQVEIRIGGRSFEVACQPGEEAFLRSAAALLDAEASAVSEQIGRMPEARMLLMAGLLLADKTTSLQAGLNEAQARLEELEAKLAAGPSVVEVPVEVPVEIRTEVPVIPTEVRRLFAEIAEEAEGLAEAIARMGSGRAAGSAS